MLGLGDVYLGAPVATPIDPRHRLVTTKYNPARTWTPENAVGIGGAYMCIYGMEGPGGYQLFGRTIQVWNTWRQTPAFAEDKPWLLNFFDQIRFFPVSHEELTEARAAFPHGALSDPDRGDANSPMPTTRRNLRANAAGDRRLQGHASRRPSTPSASAGRTQGSTASSPTRRRRRRIEGDIPAGCFGVASAVPGNIWKILVEDGAAGRGRRYTSPSSNP